jgi:hypothetical protein
MEKPYKILSLDGGGSWSILQVLTLKEVFGGNIRGHEVLRDFDMVIANSGGSIVLAALASDWTLDETVELFNNTELRLQIFNKLSYWERFFPTGITSIFNTGPKYSAERKLKAFNNIFDKLKTKELKDIPDYTGNPDLKIIVATFDALTNRARFFRSYSCQDSTYYPITLPEAIHGASNAPINYFDFPAEITPKDREEPFYLWDGALGGFNNPVAAGVIEAVKNKTPKSQIRVLSIGTGTKVMSKAEQNNFLDLIFKLKKWVKNPFAGLKFFGATVINMANTILYEPPDWANYVAYMMQFDSHYLDKSNQDKFVRLSPLLFLPPEHPEVKELLNKLMNTGMDATTDADIKNLFKCFEAWKGGHFGNQMVKANPKNTSIAIGHPTFQEGIDVWRKYITPIA